MFWCNKGGFFKIIFLNASFLIFRYNIDNRCCNSVKNYTNGNKCHGSSSVPFLYSQNYKINIIYRLQSKILQRSKIYYFDSYSSYNGIS